MPRIHFHPPSQFGCEPERHHIGQCRVAPSPTRGWRARPGPSPSSSWRYTQMPVGKENTRKKAMGFAGGGVGRRDSGVRRVDDYRGTYETVGRIEKLVDELGYRVPLRPLFFRK